MNRTHFALLLTPWLATACASSTNPTPDAPPSASPVVTTSQRTTTPAAAASPTTAGDPAARATNDFGFDLYGQLAAKPDENLAYSPTSIAIALSMTVAGARGQTEQQMHEVLHFPSEAMRLHAAWGATMERWAGLPDVEIRVANRLFGQTGSPFEDEFLALNAERYAAPFLPVDFAGAPEAQRVLINDWVAERTRKRIVDLIPPGGIDASTNLVLANALYLKSRWASPFDPHHTELAPFTTSTGAREQVSMMKQVSEIPQAVFDDAIVARLDHRGGAFATTFVMPREGHSLAALEKSISAAALSRWTAALTPKRVLLELPAVKIEPGDAVRLQKPLSALGMPLAFSGAADFSGIAPRGLFIDEVYHKAFVAMNEEGTEAAAATAVVMAESGVPSLPDAPALAFDRPFLFFIQDAKTGLVLFAGRMTQPS